jgi:putative GTP pyrophosphokinase
MADEGQKDSRKADVESVLAEFDRRKNLLDAFCEKATELIRAILKDANIRYYAVQARVKDRDKLRDKYQDTDKSYICLDDITDLAGLRIITYYEDDVDRAGNVIKAEFDIDPKHSVDLREKEPDRFAYGALHLVGSHAQKRKTDVEYKHFAEITCEIQITSILRHAWSEIEHEWYDLGKDYPKDVKKKFSRLAALVELAESEFVELRDSKQKYAKAVAVQVEANVPDIPVDSVSLRSFLDQEPIVQEIDRAIALAVGRTVDKDLEDNKMAHRLRVANVLGFTKLQDLRDALKKYGDAVPEFVRRCCLELWANVADNSASVGKGVCMFQLGLLLSGSKGQDEMVEYLRAAGRKSTALYKGVPTIAKETMEKFFGGAS